MPYRDSIRQHHISALMIKLSSARGGGPGPRGGIGRRVLCAAIARTRLVTVVVCDLDPGRLGDRAAARCPRGRARTGRVGGQGRRDNTAGLVSTWSSSAAGYDRCRIDAVEAVRDRGTLGLFGCTERNGNSPFRVDVAFRRSLSMDWINGTQRGPRAAVVPGRRSRHRRGDRGRPLAYTTTPDLRRQARRGNFPSGGHDESASRHHKILFVMESYQLP